MFDMLWTIPALPLASFLVLALLGAALLFELVTVVGKTSGAAAGAESGVKAVAISLFGPYLLGVELAAMLLLAGIVGAYHLGRREEREEESEGTR